MSSKETKREYQIEFVNWYRRTSRNDDAILRIFDRKDYYTVYGQKNSDYIADQFYRTKESISSYGSDSFKIECIHFREQQFKSIIRDFVIRQQKIVEIYSRDLNSGKWIIENKITPSNLSVGSMGEASFNLICIIMSITKQIKTLGIALCNHSTFSFEIAQFIEDEQYTKLSALFVAKGVKQCIFKCKSSKLHHSQIEKFKTCLKKANVQLIDDFDVNINHNETSIISTINNIINKASTKKLLTFNNHKLALYALNGIILHQELLKDDKNFNRYKLSQHKIDCFMRLDCSALTALNLFPTISDRLLSHNKNDGNNSSLYGLLKKCRSSMGDRLLSVWIRQPLVDIKQIYRRQKLVKLFVENHETRQLLRDQHLKSLIDLEKLQMKLQQNKATLRDLVDLYNFAEKIPWIKDTLRATKNVLFHNDSSDSSLSPLNVLFSDFINPMTEMESNFNNFLAMIEQVVDLPATANREYLIKHEFDNLLDKYDKKKRKIMHDMQSCKDKVISDLNETDKIIKLERHKSYGYCLKITKKKAKILRDKKRKYTVLSTQKNGTFFTDNGDLRKLSKSYIEYEKRYIERQKIIVDKTIEITKTYIPVIDIAISIFAELDVILSLSSVASYSPSTYVLPKILPSSCSDNNNNKMIKMKNARHPCLELIQLDDVGGVIPNDVSLIGDKSSFQIVTGPNMGGKSTYIRMIGLIVLMAQIGSYVPCDECTLTIIDSILCRVGAGDNQLRGVSTFMAEMLEASSILEAATSSSLIIIDELGRGTSTYDGYGIAYSISEYIITKLHSFCLFATHFHELSALSTQHQCVINKHVTAQVDDNEDTLTMLYKINNGPCPQSFGIQVAKLAKFPQNVIKIAKQKADQLECIGKSSISLLTYNSIQKILSKYKQITENVKNNIYAENDEKYENEIKKLKQMIEAEMDNNEELDEMALAVQSKQSDKMEID